MRLIPAITPAWFGFLLVLHAAEPTSPLVLELAPARTLGPVHLAGPGPHTVPLRVRGIPGTLVTLEGRVFRVMTSAAAPLQDFAWSAREATPPTGVLTLRPEFTLPDLESSARYLIRFRQTELPPIGITYHPTNYLEPLVEATRTRPLLLMAPPTGVPELLRKQGLSVATREAIPDSIPKGRVAVIYKTPTTTIEVAPDGRMILCDLDQPEREIWTKSARSGWKIRVHHDTCSPTALATTAGLVRLQHLAQANPNQ